MLPKPNEHRFHGAEPPHKRVRVSSLTSRTQSNISKLRDCWGVKFKGLAKIWLVEQNTSYSGQGPTKMANDILLEGTLWGMLVEFWRHETESKGAGQTLLYMNGQRHMVHVLLGTHEEEQFSFFSGLSTKEVKRVHALLLAHENVNVRMLMDTFRKFKGIT